MEQICKLVTNIAVACLLVLIGGCATRIPDSSGATAPTQSEDNEKTVDTAKNYETTEAPASWSVGNRYIENACLYYPGWKEGKVTSNETKGIVLFIYGCPVGYSIGRGILDAIDGEVSGIVFGEKADCFDSVSEVDLAEVCIDLSFLSFEKQSRVAESLPSNVGALKLRSLGCPDERQPEIFNFIGNKFVALSYIDAEICGGSEISDFMFNEVVEARLKVDTTVAAGAILKNGQDGPFGKVRKLQVRIRNESRIEEWIAEKAELQDVNLQSFVGIDVEVLSENEKLKTLEIHSDTFGKLGEDVWPKMERLVLWESAIGVRDAKKFKKKHKETVCIFDEEDAVNYLFGAAIKIDIWEKDIRAPKDKMEKEKRVVATIDDRSAIRELAESVVTVVQEKNGLGHCCTEGTAVEIHNTYNRVEKVTIDKRLDTISWHGYGDIKITEESAKRIGEWFNRYVQK